MSERLDWEKLLSSKRSRESGTEKNSNSSIDDLFYDHRNAFDKDYDRIVYSSSIRRLQDKAQVFPLQENDFTRTRLTHSLEASALGRSFGYRLGEWLYKKGEFESYDNVRKFAALIQVAGLIHDLGNPPFGHYGETIIGDWFQTWFESEEFKVLNEQYKKKGLTLEQMEDLKNFEGNAQTLRIVSKLQILNDEYGVNFTHSTLATIMKYPWDSISPKSKSNKNKFGYFVSEKNLVDEIRETTGLKLGIRHPATLLLEASDDIAYLFADIEDAVKKGIIPWEKEYEKIRAKLLEMDNETYEYMFKKLDEINKDNRKNKAPDYNLISVQNFKVYSQGLIFNHVVKNFKDNYNNIIHGIFDDELLNQANMKALVKELKRLAGKYCFENPEVLTLELVGHNVINGLLDKFVPSLTILDINTNPKTYEGKLYNLISENFRYVCCYDKEKEEKKKFKSICLYDRLLLITDFISGMTDSYAVNLYRTLLGVNLPQR